MESVDMYIDESQQAEPEENLDISEAGEEKPRNIFQHYFPETDVEMEQLAEISRDDQPMDAVTESMTKFRHFYDYKIKQLNTNGSGIGFWNDKWRQGVSSRFFD